MIIKSYLIENNINTVNQFKSILIYGENEGIKQEIVSNIKKIKDTEIIDLSDKNLSQATEFDNESKNLSLFQKNKILIVNNPKETFLKSIEEFMLNKNNVKLIIVGGMLTKKSVIRSFYEKEKKLAAIPCYKDSRINLEIKIKKELSKFTNITPTIIEQILEKTGESRLQVIEEIEKIKLYFVNKKIDENELNKLLNYNLDINLNELITNILLKNKENINKNFDKFDLNKEDVILFFSLLINQLEKIKFILLNTKKEKINLSALGRLNIKIFWKEQESFIKICNKLNLNKVEKIQSICFKNEILIKKYYEINYLSVFKRTVLELIQI